jgi:hypothetical protein
LTGDDLITLRRAVDVVKAARADTHSFDAKVADAAKVRLGIALCYVVGFLDGAGAFTPVNPGFENVFLSKLPAGDPDAELDDFLKQLDSMISQSDDTRIAPLAILGGILAIGALCKLAAALID